MLADLLFFFFAAILLVAALGVITAKNPMYCVLFMVLAFFNAAALFILMGAEFIGLLLIMVYVGAIAVMFLFVVMTIDIEFARLKQGFVTYLPVGLLVGAVMLLELLAVATSQIFYTQTPPAESISYREQIAELLYTDYMLAFQATALILLVAMVGAIVLTHRKLPNVQRQNVKKQIARTRDESITLVDPGIGKPATTSHWQLKEVKE